MTEQEKILVSQCPREQIWVCLDGSMKYNCIDLKKFKKLTTGKTEPVYIVTPLTTVIDNYYPLHGYKLYIVSHFNGVRQQVCVNDLLLGNKKPEEKDLRPAHNIERLVLNGVYEIQTNWEDEDYEQNS